MHTARNDGKAGHAARPPRRGYHEDADEPAKLLEQEPVEVEHDVPAEPNPSIEHEPRDQPATPAFEE